MDLGAFVRIFKSRWFQRFARKEGIADAVLREAVARAEKGQIDVGLGGEVIKQRIARPGKIERLPGHHPLSARDLSWRSQGILRVRVRQKPAGEYRWR